MGCKPCRSGSYVAESSPSPERPAPRPPSSGSDFERSPSDPLISSTSPGTGESSSSGQSQAAAKPAKPKSKLKKLKSKKPKKSREVKDLEYAIKVDELMYHMGMKPNRDKDLRRKLREAQGIVSDEEQSREQSGEQRRSKSPMNRNLPSPGVTTGVLQDATKRPPLRKKKSTPKPPMPKHPHRLQVPTRSQTDFFAMLDEKIAAGSNSPPQDKEKSTPEEKQSTLEKKKAVTEAVLEDVGTSTPDTSTSEPATPESVTPVYEARISKSARAEKQSDVAESESQADMKEPKLMHEQPMLLLASPDEYKWVSESTQAEEQKPDVAEAKPEQDSNEESENQKSESDVLEEKQAEEELKEEEKEQVSLDTVAEKEQVSLDTVAEAEQVSLDTVAEAEQVSLDTVAEAEQVSLDTTEEKEQVSLDTAAEAEQVSLDTAAEAELVSLDTATEAEQGCEPGQDNKKQMKAED